MTGAIATARPATGRQPMDRSVGVLGSLVRSPVSLVGLAWLALVLVLALGAPVFAGQGPVEQDLRLPLAGPGPSHLLGTDQLGRDLFSRLLYGAQVSLVGVLLATVVAVVLGSVAGLIAGYFRSAADSIASGVADLLMSIPTIVVLLSVAAVFSRNLAVLMLFLGILMSASVFRIIRSATFDIRSELYITAARTSGLGPWRILARHVVPRLSGFVVVQAAIVASVALVTQVGLGFLGIDVVPPAPSWGSLVHDASSTIGTSFWPLIPPTVAICLTVLAFSAVGDIAQQALSGRSRGVRWARPARRSAPAPAPADRHAEPRDILFSARGFSLATSGDAPVTLVDDVDFIIRTAEIVGLVGESGAGKSLTARAIVGLLPIGADTSGSLVFDGIDLLRASRAQLQGIRGKQIAFIGQEPMASLSPAFRIGAQLAEIVRTHQRVSRREAVVRAKELLETVEIADPAGAYRKYPHEISGGMAQRVAIAIALAGEPRLIIADEPTTALDVSVQMQVLELLRSLQRDRGLSVLLVTHDWGVVADLCDRAVVMYAGQVVEQADVQAIFDRPRHPYTAALRSADPHSQAGAGRLATIAGQVPAPGSWPGGCRFADRCALAEARCREAEVLLRPAGPEHVSRCVRVDDRRPEVKGGVRHRVSS